jgi:chitodextrinase
MWRFVARTACVCIFIVLFAQCGTSDNQPGEQAQIPASVTSVTFAGSTWSDVVFKHAEHSDRYHGECIKCHDHEPIAGTTHWYCRTCHTAGQDRENLCNEVTDHGCVMTQCDTCHKKQVPPRFPPQAQSCSACHTGGSVPTGDVQAPTVPTGLTATAASTSQINLSWTASTDNVAVVGYKIYRGGVYLTSVSGTSTSDTGLSAATPYCYQISAYDAANNASSLSTLVCATTHSAADPIAPTVPTGLTAVAASSTQTNLSWTASTDNVGVAGYKIYRGGVYLKSVTGTSTSDTVPANTQYCYTVSAYDGAPNESAQSTQVCTPATVAAGTTYPGTPSLILTGTIDTGGSINPWSKIDHWTLTFNTSGTIVIDVLSFEYCRIYSSGRDANGDGIFGNNRLQSNIYLFALDGTLVGSSAGGYPGSNTGLGTTAEQLRSHRNPYLSMSINPGTYILAIGNCPLSQNNAWGGVNMDSGSCAGRHWTNFDSSAGITLYNEYRVKIYFN